VNGTGTYSWSASGLPAVSNAFVLAALCPFLANYAAAALTETLEIFFNRSLAGRRK